ncbi:cell division cycle protein 20 homolog B [Elgaria multicarinata webbii]|uniref:cell division cycle protein 20 homolog B n=1 Tax=Elgaria multicarinata webbii TaxID=159646 RepID=UPI002FCCE35F
MEWKLERSAAQKVKTDEDVLWAKIMKALGTDLRKIRKPHLQTLTKGIVDTELLPDEHTSQVDNREFPITETPGKTSYSHFKSYIVKKLASQIPVASSPISTRWQQVCVRNQAEQSFAESPPTELSTSGDGSDLTGPFGRITAIPVSSKILLETTGNESITFTSNTKLYERNKTQKQEWLHQMFPSTEGNGNRGFSEKGNIRICGKPKCLWKGCKDASKAECGIQSISAHANGFSLLEPQIRFHITGLRNDYYLNLLDWSQGNLIALALGSAVHIWNGERNQNMESLDLCSRYKYIASVAWMKENAYLAFGTSDGEVQLWDIETQKRLQNMYGHMSVVGAMSWNGYMLSSGSRLGYVYHHDVRVAQRHIGMARQSKQSVCGLQWSPDNKLLACGSSDGLLNIWSNHQCGTIQCKPVTSILHSSAVKAMLWCPWQSAVIATGGGMKDRSLHIWNISSPEDLKTVNTESQICSLVWLPKTEDIVTGQGHPYNKMNIWKYPVLSNSAEYYDHKGRVLHMAVSPEGNRIFTAAADGTAYVWKCRL